MTVYKLPDHPTPVAGGARYYAGGLDVLMWDCDDGSVSVVESKRTATAALIAAMKWQIKENKAVEKERKRLAKLANL
jgi:hypothetical protein